MMLPTQPSQQTSGISGAVTPSFTRIRVPTESCGAALFEVVPMTFFLRNDSQIRDCGGVVLKDYAHVNADFR
jgi:hypothetical protein